MSCIVFLDSISSVNSNDISSVAVFQQTSRVLTSVSAVRVGPTENLIKDSSSSSTTAFAFSVFVRAILSFLFFMSWSSSLEFQFHLHKLKAPLAISSFESWWSSNPSWTLSAPVKRSSTQSDFFMNSTSSAGESLWASKWCVKVAPWMDGEGLGPKTSLQNHNYMPSELRT